MKICISTTFPGDADAPNLRPHFENHLYCAKDRIDYKGNISFLLNLSYSFIFYRELKYNV
jgi:hypothetical protein